MTKFQQDLLSGTVQGRSSQALSCEDPTSAPNAAPNVPERSQSEAAIALLDWQNLSRECLARSLVAAIPNWKILAFSKADELLNSNEHLPTVSLILLSIGARSLQNQEVVRVIALLSQLPNKPPIILLSDVEDANQILRAFRGGVRGYITTNVTLRIAVEAIHLVLAGGIYLPASSLLASKLAHDLPPVQVDDGVFSARQKAVLTAVRQGKANKIIAHELNMRESTVKVHIRNIMKKLNARNRTEVAFKTNGMFMVEPIASPQMTSPPSGLL